MPLYYFDVYDCGGLHRDEVGDHFDSMEEAVAQVQSLLPVIAREELPASEWHIIKCELRDDMGRIIYHGTLTFEGSHLQV